MIVYTSVTIPVDVFLDLTSAKIIVSIDQEDPNRTDPATGKPVIIAMVDNSCTRFLHVKVKNRRFLLIRDKLKKWQKRRKIKAFLNIYKSRKKVLIIPVTCTKQYKSEPKAYWRRVRICRLFRRSEFDLKQKQT